MSGPERVIFGFHAVLARLRAEPEVGARSLPRRGAQGRAREGLRRAGRARGRAPDARAGGAPGRHGRRRPAPGRGRARARRNTQKQTLEELLESLQEPPLLLVLDGITDPHNLGACLRVANAAGAHAVIAPKDHAAGINATVSKVASGAAEITPYFMVTNLARTLADLKERGTSGSSGADERADKTLFEADLPESDRLGAGRGRRGHAPPDARNAATCW